MFTVMFVSFKIYACVCRTVVFLAEQSHSHGPASIWCWQRNRPTTTSKTSLQRHLCKYTCCSS